MRLYSTKVTDNTLNLNNGTYLKSQATSDVYFSLPYTTNSTCTLLTTAHSGAVSNYPAYIYPIVTYGSYSDRMYVLSGMNTSNPASSSVIYNTKLSLNQQMGTSTTGTFSFESPLSVLHQYGNVYIYFTYGETQRSYAAFKAYTSTSINGTSITWTVTYQLCNTGGYAPSTVYATVVIVGDNGDS